MIELLDIKEWKTIGVILVTVKDKPQFEILLYPDEQKELLNYLELRLRK